MADETAKKRDWAVPFVARLCLIGWICALFYEAFDFFGLLRSACLLFGPWACVMALVYGLGLLLIRRQGIFLALVLLTIPPSIHFGIVLNNVAKARNWFVASEQRNVKSAAEVNSEEQPMAVPSTDPADLSK